MQLPCSCKPGPWHKSNVRLFDRVPTPPPDEEAGYPGEEEEEVGYPGEEEEEAGYNSEDEYSHVGVTLTEEEWLEKDRRWVVSRVGGG